MRLSTRLTLVQICALATAVEAQDRRGWQSLAQLRQATGFA